MAEFREWREAKAETMPADCLAIIDQAYAGGSVTKSIVGKPFRRALHKRRGTGQTRTMRAFEQAVTRAFGLAGWLCCECAGPVSDADTARVCAACARDDQS